MKELPDWFTGTVRVEPYVTGPTIRHGKDTKLKIALFLQLSLFLSK